MTPSIAIIQVYAPPKVRLKLWVPLFLLWIPAILLAPLVLLVLFVACLVGRINPFRAVAILWGILCGLRGTDVQVHAEGNQILIRLR